MVLKHGFGALAGLALAAAASPAQANETATTAQITGAVDAQGAAATGDREFTELFASWRSMDGGYAAPTPARTVSVPSRMPLDSATLTSTYGMRNHPVLGGRRNHNGVDLAAARSSS